MLRAFAGMACLCGLVAMLAPPAGAAFSAKPATHKPAAKRPVLSTFASEQQMSPAQLIARWKPLVTTASKRFGVPVTWINAVMRMESGGRTMLSENQRMVSDKGALGIMQVLPGTYRDMQLQYNLGADPFDPGDNIRAGAAYLKWLKGKYTYPALFAAYNAGPGQVDDFLAKGTPLPQETRAYIAGIGKILDGVDGTLDRVAKFTRPDGSPILVDPVAVRSVRAVFPGEYTAGVQAVIDMGVLKQGVTEDAATVMAALRIQTGSLPPK